MKKHVLSILVDNNAGVLSRVTGLFSRRGYNIDSLSVGETESPEISRITIAVICNEDSIEQIIKQVEKLIEVRRVVDMTKRQAVFRELALIKANCTATNRGEIISIVDIYRANIIDVATESMTIEITGNQNKIESFIMLMNPYGVKEIVRTGLTALCRGNNPIKNYIKQELE
ncbi:MAG: acetolactate synthase small subunit [Clostridiales bacterium]|nr:acetolactate synthase small subunit [Clostridiales bacterium]